MKKILLDINIILDLLNKRADHISAAMVYDLVVNKKVKGFLCAHEITTLSYFLDKDKLSSEKRNFIINNLLNEFTIIPATEKVLRAALISNIQDYEDAVIDASAENESLDFIVTRNLDDFEKGNVKSFNASQILQLL